MLTDILLTLHLILLIIISIRVLTRYDLSPQARMAWIVVLFIVPYLGVVVYWVFGEVHIGYRYEKRSKEVNSQLYSRYKHVLGNIETIKTKLPFQYHAALEYGAKETHFEATDGNHATLMQDGRDTNNHMLADFESAKKEINVLYYIWLADGTGSNVADALIRAAKRGVKCRAMVDGMGSCKFIGSKLWRDMERAGVELAVSRPINNLLKVMLFSRLDLRNHRKITVIDGKVVYVGSRNCADPEFRVKAKYAPWVDIMLRFTGPVVAQQQLLFASDWLKERTDTPYDDFIFVSNPESVDNSKPEQAITPKTEDGFIAQSFVDGPMLSPNVTPQFLNALIVQAQNNIIISTPYFVPNMTLINVLCATAYRGVDVTMIFPKNNDSTIVSATSHSYYWSLLEAGITIYEFKPGLLHAKTLTIDGEVSLIGSTNLDMRSFDLNYENNVVLYDQNLTEQIVQRQKQYIADSEIVTREKVKNWNIPYRIWINAVATMGPIL